jgi:plastocyanin
MRQLMPVFLMTALIATAMLVLRAAPARSLAMAQARSGSAQITVVMKEFRFIVSTRSVRTGAVVFRLVNRGHVAHDFKIAGKKSALIAPGKGSLLRVVFRRAGRYPYVCTVPGHAAAGMKGVLKVTR